MFFIVLATLTLIASVLMILAVVIQNSKGGGLSSTFGGASQATQILGARRSSEYIEKITWYLAVAIAVISILANLVGTSGPTESSLRMEQSIDGAVNTAPISTPTFDTEPAEAQPLGNPEE